MGEGVAGGSGTRFNPFLTNHKQLVGENIDFIIADSRQGIERPVAEEPDMGGIVFVPPVRKQFTALRVVDEGIGQQG